MTRKDFVNAEAKLKEVTLLGYALLPNFKDLWNYTADEHHSEYIFDIEYEEGIGEGSVKHASISRYEASYDSVSNSPNSNTDH